MLTVVASDLHLGTREATDVARLPGPRAQLLEAVSEADRIVLLGDVLELRERPIARVLAAAEPFLRDLGEAAAGKELVVVPGNHDHEIAAPYLQARELEESPATLEPEWVVDADGRGILGRLAAFMPQARVKLAYPGIRLRDDVFATHGHYLDAHLTIPRVESVVVAGIGRVVGVRHGTAQRVSQYEASLAPLYAIGYRLAQFAPERTVTRGGGLSREVWSKLNGGGRRSVTGFLIGSVAIPAVVGGLNAAGIGPFNAEISGEELRDAGLRAMADVARGLRVDDGHVLFGHTHRPGPLPGDDETLWRLPAGGRLWNTGSWQTEPVLSHDSRESPYWPGTIVRVRDSGDPEVVRLLADLEPRELDPAAA